MPQNEQNNPVLKNGIIFHDKRTIFKFSLEKEKADWLIKTLDILAVSSEKTLTFSQLKTDFETNFDDFELFWYSKSLKVLKSNNRLHV